MSQVPEDVKSARLTELQALITKQQQKFNSAMRGLTVDVLIEGHGKRPGQLVGKSPWLQAVHVNAPAERIGTIAPVTIEAIGSNTLSGALRDATQGQALERAIA